MGLDINGTRFLLFSKIIGVDFSRCATLGRQSLHLNPADLEKNLLEFGVPFDESTVLRIFNSGGYAEEFLKFLGAKAVHSYDKNHYEKATHLHDMNQEIPHNFRAQYSVVLDGGSLEHIFNFPQAIKNCMEMVEIGGFYLGITPANNFLGHGFYQFSPELFFSVFTSNNGYELMNVFAFEASEAASWFAVKDPSLVHERVTLTNSEEVYLLVIARRVKEKKIFESIPQQSDYVSTWKRNESPTIVPSRSQISPMTTLFQIVPKRLRRIVKELFRSKHSAFNPRFFLRIDPVKITRDKQRKL